MKKTVLVLGIMASVFATSAALANTQSTDFDFSATGDASIIHNTELNKTYAEGYLKGTVSKDVLEGVKVFGSAKVGIESTEVEHDERGEFFLDEAFVGFTHADVGTFSYGSQDSTYEDIRDFADYSVEFGGNKSKYVELYGDDQVLKYTNSILGYEVSLSGSSEDEDVLSASVRKDFGPVALAVAVADSSNETAYLAAGSTVLLGFDIAVGVEHFEEEDSTNYQVGVRKEVLQDLTLLGTTVMFDDSTKEDLYTVGGVYSLTANVDLAAEVKFQDSEEEAFLKATYKF